MCDVNTLRRHFTARFGSAFATSTDEVHLRQPRIRKTTSILEISTMKMAPRTGASAVGARRRTRHAPAHWFACNDEITISVTKQTVNQFIYQLAHNRTETDCATSTDFGNVLPRDLDQRLRRQQTKSTSDSPEFEKRPRS